MNVSGSLAYKKKIDEAINTDVLVCGGGPAGTAAAISSAREGADTLLIEQNGFLGGTATASEVAIWLGSYDRNGEYPVVGGIFREILEELAKVGGAVLPEEDIQIGEPSDPNRIGSPFVGYGPHGNSAPVTIEAVKRVSEQLVLEAGSDILYFTSAVEPVYNSGELEGVVVFGKDGLRFVRAKRLVDATGDADMLARAGGEFRKGRDKDGKTTPATLMFSVSNVDAKKFARYCQETGDSRFRKIISKLKEEKNWPFPFDIMIFMKRPFREGHFLVNTLRQRYIDGTKAKSLTRGMVDGRRQAKQLFDIARNNVPGFGEAVFEGTASRIGIRESRRIIGEYTLSEEDIINGKSFEDTVAMSGYKWDLPNPDKPSVQEMEGRSMVKPYIEIPFRALLPKDVRGMIVPGRSLSTTWHALGPVREMPPCYAMGHAAGTAAAMSVKKGIDLDEINHAKLQDRLESSGAICRNPDQAI